MLYGLSFDRFHNRSRWFDPTLPQRRGRVGHPPDASLQSISSSPRLQPALRWNMAWERVYTVNAWWDRARLGVADVRGVPHIYQSPFDPLLDDYSDFYLVSPIKPRLLELVLEGWEIWKRWGTAFDSQATSLETHPALPEDRARHERIKHQINGQLVIDPANNKKLNARFQLVAPGWDGLEVEWSEREL